MSRWCMARSLGLLLITAVNGAAQLGDHPYCQILDRFEEPVWRLELGYVTREKVKAEGGSDFGMTELGAGAGLAYLRSDLATLDLRAQFDGWVFIDRGGADLPDQVGSLRLEVSGTHRLPSGLSFQLTAYPGLYSDFEDISGEDFFVPLEFLLIRALHESLSAQAGLAVFPGFEQVVDPRLGLRWGVSDSWLLDLFYPESRIVFAPQPGLRIYAGLRALLYPEFQLQQGDLRESFRYSEWRWYGGLELPWGETSRVMLRAGRVFNREIDFADFTGGADVEDAFFVDVGLGGFL